MFTSCHHCVSNAQYLSILTVLLLHRYDRPAGHTKITQNAPKQTILTQNCQELAGNALRAATPIITFDVLTINQSVTSHDESLTLTGLPTISTTECHCADLLESDTS